MKKNVEKKSSMNLFGKLLESIRNTLMDNGYLLSKKTEKRISKSSRKIVEKSKKQSPISGKKQKAMLSKSSNHVL